MLAFQIYDSLNQYCLYIGQSKNKPKFVKQSYGKGLICLCVLRVDFVSFQYLFTAVA